MVGTRSGEVSALSASEPAQPSPGSMARQKAKATTQSAQKKQRTRLNLDDGSGTAGTVVVSSGVAIAAGGHGSGDSSNEDEGDNNRAHRGGDSPTVQQQEAPPRRVAPPIRHSNLAAAAPPTNAAGEVDWYDALTPAQLRSMMRDMMRAPPAAPGQQVVVPAPQPARPKRKKLMISDFHGKPDESVEAWLASVLKEAENQANLGGDEWTVNELYYGAIQHLKGKAEKWFITWSQHVKPEDQTFAYLVKKMRGKYSRKENQFRLQQRLARRVQQPGERLSDFADSLVDIGFGKNVSDETYQEAFLSGMNNELLATQVRTSNPETLEDAVQFAIENCGEYGEGLSVTDWRTAQSRYRRNRGAAAPEVEEVGSKRKAAKSELASQFDWKQLGFGADAQPVYDTSGDAVNGLMETAKKDPVSLATLRALMVLVGVGDKGAEAVSDQNAKPAASKNKARALEIKAERAPAAGAEQQAAPSREWQPQPAGTGGRGFGSRWTRGGRGGGRATGLENYGPLDNRPIAQRKAETTCSYCGLVGHWWRECATRQAHSNATVGQQSTAAASSDQTPDDTEEKAAVQTAQGNGRRQ